MPELVPDSGDLIVTTELEFVDATVTATGFSAVEDWDWTISGIGPAPSDVEDVNFLFAGEGFEFTAEYVDEVGLFPLQFVRYRLPDLSLDQVDNWADLPDPEDAPQIVKMREDDKDLLEWSLSVTATGLDTEGDPATASGSYLIRVFANYDTSQQLLLDAVDARR